MKTKRVLSENIGNCYEIDNFLSIFNTVNLPNFCPVKSINFDIYSNGGTITTGTYKF